MKKLMIFALAGLFFISCEKDEETIEVKDYGMKTFVANLDYQQAKEHGAISYKRQVFFSLTTKDSTHVGRHGKDSWTSFDIPAKKTTTTVKDWDLYFGYYKGFTKTRTGEMVPYGLTGVLANTEIETGMMQDTTSTDKSKAFAELKLKDIKGVKLSKKIDGIGHAWKSIDMKSFSYKVHDHYFYIVKKQDETYKLRFTSFYGDTKKDRVIKVEYQLMN